MIAAGLDRRRGLATRLQGWALWWRHSYHFRLAHRPLCKRFADGVWRIGPVHVCRSCTLMYAGLVLAALALLVIPPPAVWHGLATAVLLPIVAVWSYPPRYHHFRRPAKDALRFAAGALIALVMGHVCRGQPLWGTATLVVLWAAYRISLREYAKQKARACDECPELGAGDLCSGFQLQAAGARRYALTVERKMFAASASGADARPPLEPV